MYNSDVCNVCEIYYFVYSNVLVPLVVVEAVKSSVAIDNIQLNGQSTTLTSPR